MGHHLTPQTKPKPNHPHGTGETEPDGANDGTTGETPAVVTPPRNP